MTILLYTQVADAIEKYIQDKEFPAGTKLPSERKLAVRYHVSRNVVRSALQVLHHRGVLEVVPSKGAFVTAVNRERMRQMLRQLFVTESDSFLNCIEVREMLETCIAQKALEYMDEGKIALLESTYATMEEARKANDIDSFLKQDAEFHMQIANCIPNPLFCLLLSTFFDISPINFFQFNRTLDERFDYSQRDHRKLIDAFKLHDEKLVINTVQDSMDNVRIRLNGLDP